MTQNKRLTPILIGGTGRSGTTILFRLLQSHPRVVKGPTELRIHIDPGGALDLVHALTDNWSPYQGDIAIQRFIRLMHDTADATPSMQKLAAGMQRLNVSPPRYPTLGFAKFMARDAFFRRVDQLIAELSFHTTSGNWSGSAPFVLNSKIYETEDQPREKVLRVVGGFIEDLYAHMAKDNQTHWVESTPYTILHAPQLLELMPTARFVHVYRHPLDVLGSYVNFKWGGDDLVTTARRLASVYQRWLEVQSQMPATSVYELNLEKLTEAPQRYIAELCAFVGLDQPDQFQFGLIDTKKAHSRRWEQDIPKDLLAKVREILNPYIEHYGYQDLSD
jgi:hypothetical protein